MPKEEKGNSYLNWKKGPDGYHHERSDAECNIDERRMIKAKYSWVTHLLKNTEFKKVIDIGCGLGFGTNLLHKAGYEVIGLDYSKQAIDIASKRYPEIEFLTCLITEYYPDYRFDVGVAMDVLEHFENYVEALKRMITITKDEGLLFFSTPNRRSETTNPHHVKEFNYREIKTLFPGSTITGFRHKYVSGRLLKLVTKDEEKAISLGFKLDQLPPFSWYPYGYDMFLIHTKPKDINI